VFTASELFTGPGYGTCRILQVIDRQYPRENRHEFVSFGVIAGEPACKNVLASVDRPQGTDRGSTGLSSPEGILMSRSRRLSGSYAGGPDLPDVRWDI
jgi:hypothetical protein